MTTLLTAPADAVYWTYAAEVTSLVPRSGVLAAWANSYLAGRCSLDDAVTGIVAADRFHRVGRGADEEGWSVRLGRLRGSGATAVRLLLPAPGDVADLPGPAAFNRSALESRECAVVDTASPTGFVPEDDEAGGVFWLLAPVDRPRPLLGGTGEATRALAEAMAEGSEVLERLDLAAGRDRAGQALREVDLALSALVLPESLEPRAVALISRGIRLAGMASVALHSEGAAVTAAESAGRSAALVPRARAARRAVEAGFSARQE